MAETHKSAWIVEINVSFDTAPRCGASAQFAPTCFTFEWDGRMDEQTGRTWTGGMDVNGCGRTDEMDGMDGTDGTDVDGQTGWTWADGKDVNRRDRRGRTRKGVRVG